MKERRGGKQEAGSRKRGSGRKKNRKGEEGSRMKEVWRKEYKTSSSYVCMHT
jgi:hypothetical protein